MPDLLVQLRQYAEYAANEVLPVDAGEVTGGTESLGRARRRRLRRRTAASVIAAAAVIGLGIVVLTVRNASERVDIATGPGPSAPTAPTVPTTLGVVSAGGESFAAAVRARGTPGPRRSVPGGVSIAASTISGQSFRVTVPEDLPGLDALLVVPDATVGTTTGSTPRTYLTTMSAANVAAGSCADVPVCSGPHLEEERVLPSGAVYTRWDAGSAGENTVTVTMGEWTLVLEGPDDSAAAAIAAALAWSVDPDGYLVLRSVDPAVHVGRAGVTLAAGTSGNPADGVRIHVTPGCAGDQSTNQPAVGPALDRVGITTRGLPAPIGERPAYLGRWCASGGYAVEIVTGDEQLLERLHATLRVTPE